MDKRKVRLDLFTARWDENRDYQAEMNAITSKGNLSASDYKQLASLEAARNAKISDLNASGINSYGATATNKYSGWLDNTDYSANINDYISSGGTDYNYVQGLLNSRINKQNTAEGMKELYGDPAYDVAVQQWIDQQKGNSVYMQQLQQIMAQQQAAYDDLYDLLNSQRAPQYNDKWDDVKQRLADAALGMNYDDWTNSEQYENLAKRYGLYGDQSMRNTMGQLASRTGGLASSYAAQSAQQSYNDYMAQLEQAAYDMYANEQNTAFQKASAAFDYSDNDYDRYLQDLAQYNKDRSYAFDVLSAALDQSNYAAEWAYQLQQDQLANDWKQRQWDYGVEQDQIANDLAREKFEYQKQQDLEAAAAQMAKASSSKSSGSSGSSSRSYSEDYDSLFDAASKATSPQNYISSHYKDHGFKSVSGLWAAYQDWAKGQNGSPESGNEAGYSNYAQAMRMAGQYLNEDDLDSANVLINQIWDRLSSSQKQAAKEAFARYGITLQIS